MNLKEALITIIEQENPGILPDEAEWTAHSALKFYHLIHKADALMLQPHD